VTELEAKLEKRREVHTTNCCKHYFSRCLLPVRLMDAAGLDRIYRRCWLEANVRGCSTSVPISNQVHASASQTSSCNLFMLMSTFLTRKLWTVGQMDAWKWILPPCRNICRHWLFSTTLTTSLIQKIIQVPFILFATCFIIESILSFTYRFT
jgi:hypothetical protein